MKKLICVLFLSLLPLTSQAIVEARLGYGQNTFDDDTQAGGELQTMRGLNADVIIYPPLITDLGFGIRYEKMVFDIDGINGEADFDRLSALINYRFIDTLFYVGVIGTVGLKTDLEVKALGQTTSYDDKLNFSAGVEAGAKLGIFTIGGEIGKLWAKFDAPSGSSEMDLGSIYMKAIVGLSF